MRVATGRGSDDSGRGGSLRTRSLREQINTAVPSPLYMDSSLSHYFCLFFFLFSFCASFSLHFFSSFYLSISISSSFSSSCFLYSFSASICIFLDFIFLFYLIHNNYVLTFNYNFIEK